MELIYVPTMAYSLLADLILVVHAGYVLFIIGGQILILAGWTKNWQWPRNFWFRIVHLIAIGFVMLETWIGMTCPLTTLENLFRDKAGMAIYERSFIGEWINRLLFYDAPVWAFTLIYTLFFLLVFLTLWLYPPSRK